MKALIASLLIHLLIVISIQNSGQGDKQQQQKQEQHKGSSSKETSIFAKDKDQPPKVSINLKGDTQEKSKPQRECEDSYVGIGVIVSWLDESITYVAPDGPADIAGVEVGDVIVSPAVIRNKFEPDTLIDLKIMRRGIILHKKAKVEEICTIGSKDDSKESNDP